MLDRLSRARDHDARGAVDDPLLSSWCDRAEAAFPGVRVERAAAVAWLAKRLESLAREDDAAAAKAIDGEAGLELFLAAALALRAKGADAAFDARYFAPLGTRLGGVRLDAAGLDEAKQRAREKLLVPDATGETKLGSYAGQGKLGGLVRVVVTREAISVARATRREVPEEAGGGARAGDLAAWDPGIAALEGRARDAFKSAFEHAARAHLTSRERNLLRLHLLNGVTLDRLATMHGVHRATVVRWIAAAREKLLAETKKGVGNAIGLGGPELDSLMRAVESRLEASVERVLATIAPDVPERD